MITKESLKKQLDTLHVEGSALLATFGKKQHDAEPFETAYQRWYTRALPLMKQLAADRYGEFRAYYDVDDSRPLVEPHNYVIQDYLLGRKFALQSHSVERETARCVRSQLALLKSVTDRLEWQLVDTADQAGRGVQLDTLETARDLIRVDERAAGAVAGTVLHGFLRVLAAKHKLKFRKLSPSARELAEALKTANALDVPSWSQCTWLAEIHARSLSTGESPTKAQVRDLIDGTHWLITNVF